MSKAHDTRGTRNGTETTHATPARTGMQRGGMCTTRTRKPNCPLRARGSRHSAREALFWGEKIRHVIRFSLGGPPLGEAWLWLLPP